MQAKRNIGPFTSAWYSAEIAMEVLDGTRPAPMDMSRADYVLYCIARALADMARAMDQQAAEGDEQ